ncbi:MAG: hypothetical protein ACFE0O_15705 [Opitutales bacterium]
MKTLSRLPHPVTDSMRCVSRTLITLTVSGGLALAPITQGALSLTLDFSSFSSGEPSGSLFGGGNPQSVVEAAASYWETAFADSTASLSQTISVTWGGQMTSGVLATGGASFNSSGDLSNGMLTFDNDGSSEFFVDPTPFDSSEWSLFNTNDSDLGGGSLNVERRYTSGSGAAGTYADFLSVAIHEIGHAIGVLSSYPLWEDARDADSDASDIDVTAPRPFAGSEIPITGAHIDSPLSNTNLSTSIISGQRKLLSEADILLVAEVHGFDNLNLDPNPIPEPQMAGLVALVGLFVWQRRRRST